MKLAIFVHDFDPQIGHSRAMIELINGLSPDKKNQITEISVITFTSSDLNSLFPDFNCKKQIHYVPFKNLNPFLLKMFWYHIYSYLLSIFKCNDMVKIGVGIAALNVDISNIQFVHEQWMPLFFNQRQLSPLALIYKKILSFYFKVCEHLFFKSKKRHYITIAKFIEVFLESKFSISPNQFSYIPSAVNLNEFTLSNHSSLEVFNELCNEYPQLKIIDLLKPIVLFVGAYERKGLDLVLKKLSETPDTQLIVIGKSENKNNWNFPKNLKLVTIHHTKKVQKFYEISDTFFFPTYYEPFGLVILEAYAMGMDLIIPSENTGASEVIPPDEGVLFLKNYNLNFDLHLKKLDREEKLQRRNQRVKKIAHLTWENGAKTFQSILFKY